MIDPVSLGIGAVGVLGLQVVVPFLVEILKDRFISRPKRQEDERIELEKGREQEKLKLEKGREEERLRMEKYALAIHSDISRIRLLVERCRPGLRSDDLEKHIRLTSVADEILNSATSLELAEAQSRWVLVETMLRRFLEAQKKELPVVWGSEPRTEYLRAVDDFEFLRATLLEMLDEFEMPLQRILE